MKDQNIDLVYMTNEPMQEVYKDKWKRYYVYKGKKAIVEAVELLESLNFKLEINLN